MRIPVDEKNFSIMQAHIEGDLLAGERIEPLTPLSICKACFTNVRVT